MQPLIYFLIWAVLIVVMMRFGCGAHVLGHGHGRGHGDRRSGSERGPGTEIDPVCGMSVPTATAKTFVHGGTTYYFCSQDCRDKFEAAPQRYAGLQGPRHHSEEHAHG